MHANDKDGNFDTRQFLKLRFIPFGSRAVHSLQLYICSAKQTLYLKPPYLYLTRDTCCVYGSQYLFDQKNIGLTITDI